MFVDLQGESLRITSTSVVFNHPKTQVVVLDVQQYFTELMLSF